MELYVEVHDVQDEVELVEVHLVLKQSVAVPGDLHKELVFKVLSHLGVLKPLHVVDRLQHRDVRLVRRKELPLVLLEELTCLVLEVL